MTKTNPPILYVNLRESSKRINRVNFKEEKVFQATDSENEAAEVYIPASLVGDALFKMENCSCPFSDDPNGVAKWIKETAEGTY